jgi:hypothetical protein
MNFRFPEFLPRRFPIRIIRGFALLYFGSLMLFFPQGKAAEWIRAGMNTNQPIWGRSGGLLFAIPPGSFSGGDGGPRGLIRLGYPTLTNGGYDLINFIAVEPVVRGKKGFSELENSSVDKRQGKRFSTSKIEVGTNNHGLNPGRLGSSNGVEILTIPLFVERFENGAHVRLQLSQRSDERTNRILCPHRDHGKQIPRTPTLVEE